MRLRQTISILLLAVALLACGESKGSTQTPLETLKAYTQAVKKNDIAQMKRLLSNGSLKMAQNEAQAQNVPIDEVVKRQTLFPQNLKTVEFRNEKIEGEKATIEVKNAYGTYDVVPFIKENGEWKIDQERSADELIKQVEEENRRLEEQINQSRQP
jgi:anti-sigma28 factor (negative regulator of flagellin synthesis)